jgi:hypothetical protein
VLDPIAARGFAEVASTANKSSSTGAPRVCACRRAKYSDNLGIPAEALPT